MPQPRSRYEHTLRSSAADRAAKLLRLASVGAVLTLPLACGNNDAEVFATNTTSNSATPTTQAANTDGSASSDSASSDSANGGSANSDSANSDSAGSASANDPGRVDTGALVAVEAELVVSFTYEASSTERTKRPYIAVWLEDSDGELVDTISLWYEQGGKGQKWLDDLRQWYAVGADSDTTVSGATRVAGEYIVSWDGTDSAGNKIPQGDYVLYIEAAREHGPYSLTSADLSIGDQAFVVAISDNEELSNISTQLLL